MSHVEPFPFDQYSHLFILTGAGISAASGLPTFRGPDGLLLDEAMWASDAANLPESLPALWKLYGGLRQKTLEVQPNSAHDAIAHLQKSWGERGSFTLATQNVDGLHQRAGSWDVAELHGSVLRSRCMNPRCSLVPFFDENSGLAEVPKCPKCRQALRPDIVLFSEMLPVDVLERVGEALRRCDLFLAVGTSGTVSPASDFVRLAHYAGARTVLVNLEPMQPPNPYFQQVYYGRAEEILPQLCA